MPRGPRWPGPPFLAHGQLPADEHAVCIVLGKPGCFVNKTNACLCHEAPLASCAPARGPGVGALAGQGLSGTPLLLGRKRDGPGSRGEASRSHPPGGQGGSPLNLEVGTPRTVSPAGLHPCFSAWTSGDLHSPGATFSFSVRPSGLIRAKQPTVRAWQGAELPVQVLIFLDLQSCGTVGSQGAVLGQVHEDLAVPGTHTHTHTHTHSSPLSPCTAPSWRCPWLWLLPLPAQNVCRHEVVWDPQGQMSTWARPGQPEQEEVAALGTTEAGLQDEACHPLDREAFSPPRCFEPGYDGARLEKGLANALGARLQVGEGFGDEGRGSF